MRVECLYAMPSDQMNAEDRAMHTQDNEAQFAPTVTSGTTGVEKKNKDTSGGATESLRIRRGMSSKA